MGRPKKNIYAEMFTKRKDGRYQYTYRDEKTGARKYLYDKDPIALYDKVYGNTELHRPVTVREMGEAWQDEHWPKIRPGTQASYDAPLRRILEKYGDDLLEDISAETIYLDLLREKEQAYSAKHAATTLLIWRQIFQYALLHNKIKYNPAAQISVPRGMHKGKRQLPSDSVIPVIKNNLDKEYGLFPYFILYTGFRAAEAAAVTWGDIDFKNKTVSCDKALDVHTYPPSIKPPKTEAGIRTVPLLRDLEEALKEKRPANAKSTDLIFPGKNGNPMSRSAMAAKWRMYCKETGLAQIQRVQRTHSTKHIVYTANEFHPTVTAHQLRHLYCSILYEAGIDELTAQELMGHSDYMTTRKIYTHLRNSKKKEVTDTLNKAFGNL